MANFATAARGVARGKNVVQAAVADVVRPAIAAHDPDGALDQTVGHAKQILGLRRGTLAQRLLDLGYPLALLVDASLGGLICVQDGLD
jgi:hypothetical protein